MGVYSSSTSPMTTVSRTLSRLTLISVVIEYTTSCERSNWSSKSTKSASTTWCSERKVSSCLPGKTLSGKVRPGKPRFLPFAVSLVSSSFLRLRGPHSRQFVSFWVICVSRSSSNSLVMTTS